MEKAEAVVEEAVLDVQAVDTNSISKVRGKSEKVIVIDKTLGVLSIILLSYSLLLLTYYLFFKFKSLFA